jgi:2'-hydroxyisoflavone reductase
VSTTRRDFLKTSAAATGALGLGVFPTVAHAQAAAPARSEQPRAQRALRILILGGTGFIGPHQVRYARERGHTVTLFNRGRTNPGLFPNVESLQGDRAVGDYKSLAGRSWDVVIDNPTTIPRWVRQAGEALKGRVGQYVFISTISVYAANDTPGADETAAVATTTEPESEDARRFYGPLKALSEKEAERAFPGATTVIRPGLIVGPGDNSDRFTYWPVRLARGGEVLAPGSPTDPVQIVDARDLSEFAVRCAENRTVGVYNVTGPRSELSVGEMLGGIRATMSNDARLTWVDADFLQAQRVQAWSHMPVWVPPRGSSAGFARRSIQRALDKGLTFRPLADTVKATLEFYEAQTEQRKAELRAGLDPQREKEVLAAWHARAR